MSNPIDGPMQLTIADFAELQRLCERLAFATGASLPPKLGSLQDVMASMSSSIDICGKRVHRGRQDQRQLRQIREELERVEKLKSKFIRSVSHELRTPLASIEGFTRALLKMEESAEEGHDSSETRHQFLMIINREVQRLEELIEAVLDLSEAEANASNRTATLFPARDIFDEALRAIEPSAKPSSVLLRLKPNPDGPMVYADRDDVREILRQLLSNAQKFSNGDDIVLSAEPVSISPDATPTESGLQPKVTGATRIYVKDRGVGIPADELDHVFDKFYRVERTSASFPGNGIGLSLVRALVGQNNGQVWAESDLGRGATFFVLLPNQPAGKES